MVLSYFPHFSYYLRSANPIVMGPKKGTTDWYGYGGYVGQASNQSYAANNDPYDPLDVFGNAWSKPKNAKKKDNNTRPPKKDNHANGGHKNNTTRGGTTHQHQHQHHNSPNYGYNYSGENSRYNYGGQQSAVVTGNICGNPQCGLTFICNADYNRRVQPLGYPGVR